jgi:hypothetical protein
MKKFQKITAVTSALALILSQVALAAPVGDSGEQIPISVNNYTQNVDETTVYTELNKADVDFNVTNVNSKPATVEIKDIKIHEPKVQTEYLYQSPDLYEKAKEHRLELEESKSFLQALIPTAHAYDNPILELNVDEFSVLDAAMFFVSQMQNESEGSFGDYNKYLLTSDVVDLLGRTRRTGNDQFDHAVEYLQNTDPQTNEEKAMKIRLLNSLGQDYQNLLDELVAAKNNDNGYGFRDGFASDLSTTIEVLHTFNAIGYNENDYANRALLYILNHIHPDGAVYDHTRSTANPSIVLVNRTLRLLEPYAGLSLGGDGEIIFEIDDKIADMRGFLEAAFDHENLTFGDEYDLVHIIETYFTYRLYNIHPDVRTSIEERIEISQRSNGSFGGSLEATVLGIKALAKSDLDLISVNHPAQVANNAQQDAILNIVNRGYTATSNVDLHIFLEGVHLVENLNLQDLGFELTPGQTAELTLDMGFLDKLLNENEIHWYIEDEGLESDFTNNFQATQIDVQAVNGANPIPPLYSSVRAVPAANPTVSLDFYETPDPNRERYLVGIKPAANQNYEAFYNIPGPISFGLPTWNDGDELDFIVLSVGPNNNFTVSEAGRVTVGNVAAHAGQISGAITIPAQPGRFLDMNIDTTSDSSGDFESPLLVNGKLRVQLNEPEFENLAYFVNVLPGQITDAGRLIDWLQNDDIEPVVISLTSPDIVDNTASSDSVVGLEMIVSDNVAVKSVNLEFYNPNLGYWEMIEAISTEQESQTNFEVSTGHYLAADLLGDGFKYRATAADFRGNISNPFETPEFSIEDGRPPVVVEGVNAAGERDGIKVQWQEFAEAQNFSAYNIYRTADNSDEFADLQPVHTYDQIERNFYIDREVNLNQDYFYAVTVVDSLGQENTAVDWIGPVRATEVVNNFLTDGDAETANVDEWRRYGNPEPLTKSNQAYDGKQSLEVRTNTAEHPRGGWQRTGFSVQEDQAMRLSMRLNILEAEEVTILVGDGSSNADLEDKKKYYYGATDGWVEYSRDIRFAEASDDIRVVARTVSGHVLFDSVVLEPIPDPGLIADGDMESPESWPRYGNPDTLEKTTDFAVSGTQSLKILTNTPENPRGGTQVVNVPVKKSTWYRLTGKIKVDAGSASVLVGINSSNSDFEGKKETFTTEPGFQDIERDFRVPDNFDGGLRLVISTRNAEVYLDDINLVELGDLGLIVDGDMEREAPWNPYGNPNILEKTTDVVFEGQRSLHVNTTTAENPRGGAQVTRVAVQPDTRYLYSFMYRIDAGDLNADSRVQAKLGINSSNSDFRDAYPTLRDTGGQWVPYETEITIPADFDPDVDDFRVVFSTRNVDFYLDNVSLSELEPSTNLAADGDMEREVLGDWLKWSNEPLVLEKRQDVVHQGERSLYLETASAEFAYAGLQQINIDVEAGRTYRLGYWHHLDGVMIPRLGIRDSNEDFEFPWQPEPNQVPVLSGRGEGWEYYERVFTVPADFERDFRFVVALYAQHIEEDGSYVQIDHGELYIDDVVIEEI